MCEADDEGRLSGEFFLEWRCCSRTIGPIHIDLQSLKVCRARLLQTAVEDDRVIFAERERLTI